MKSKCIYIIIDSTGSMGSFIKSLNNTLKELYYMCKILSNNLYDIKIISYRDYSDALNPQYLMPVWLYEYDNVEINIPAYGGGDAPEALRTALNILIDDSKQYENNLVLIYTDAPPHSPVYKGSNYENEKEILKDKFEWNYIKDNLKNHNIYTFYKDIPRQYYLYSIGYVIGLDKINSEFISKMSINVLLQLFGEKTEIINGNYLLNANHENKNEENVLMDFSDINQSSLIFNKLDWIYTYNFENKIDIIYECFNELFTIKYIQCILYNNFIGKLWRNICKFKGDERIKLLCDKLSLLVSNTNNIQIKTKIQEWIEKSYDNSDYIIDKINNVENNFPCLVLDGYKDLPDKKELRNISVNSSKKLVRNLPLHIIIQKEGILPYDNGVPKFIPLSLSDEEIFELIPNLSETGYIYTKRLALNMAMLCYEYGVKELKDISKRLLEKVKGTWIGLKTVRENPDIASLDFIKLSQKNKNFLSDYEKNVYDNLYKLHRFRKGKSKMYDLQIPYKPNVNYLTFDHKLKCSKCEKLRSVSLMTEEDICTVCLHDYISDPIEEKSYLTNCTCCNAVYAVDRPYLLATGPKCYYCRENKKVPTYQCDKCKNKFVCPNEKYNTNLCAHCSNNKNPYYTLEVSLYNLCQQNKGLLGISDIIFKNYTYFQILSDNLSLNHLLSEASFNDKLKYDNKYIFNQKEIIFKVNDDLINDKYEDNCQMCFEEFSLLNLNKACGKCDNLVCDKCMTEWYSQIKPGHIVLETYIKCPFCKNIPKRNTIKKFNKKLMNLMFSVKEFDHSMYYALCYKCIKIKEYMNKECANDIPDLKHFECDDHQINIHTMNCPSCDIITEKSFGCDHITCTQCNEHWCYACGMGFGKSDMSIDNCYSHMETEHDFRYYHFD